MNMQNQGQPTAQTITAANAQTANAKYQQEAGSELANAPGQISQYLLNKSKTGFEFGSMGSNKANISNAGMMNQNSELNQSGGQISQTLAQESR